MADNYGVSFAPTQEHAQQGPLNGQIDGLPAAIKILALRFPKFFGASAPAPAQLLTAPGAQGIDPVASAVLATMAKAMGSHTASMGLPGGTAGPNQLPPGFQSPGGGGGSLQPQAQTPDATTDFGIPKVVFQPNDPLIRRTPFGGGGGGFGFGGGGRAPGRLVP